MRVGIVIPSYNQGKYFERAIKSVLANRKYVDIDIAVIDGASEDDTLEIIKKYERVIQFWCSEKDNGQADAINKGIKAIPNCDYYMWLNSDDIFENDHSVYDIVMFAISNKYDVCYGLSHFIDENDNIIGEYPTEEYDKDTLGNRCYISQPSVLFSRKAYEKVGGLNTRLCMCLDYEYWIRLSQEYDFGYLQSFIGCTRIYGETKTSLMKKRHLEEAIHILYSFFSYVPMSWIVAYILEIKNFKLLKVIPKRILFVILTPFRRKIIQKIEEREQICLKR